MTVDEIFKAIGDEVKKNLANALSVEPSTITDQMAKDQLAKGWYYGGKKAIRCAQCRHIFALTVDDAKSVGSQCYCGNKLNFA